MERQLKGLNRKHHVELAVETPKDSSPDHSSIFGNKSDSNKLFPSLSDSWPSVSPGRYPENEQHVPHMICEIPSFYPCVAVTNELC